MSETLDAMVKAMAGELERQRVSGPRSAECGYHCLPAEDVDVEAVARAGLAAISSSQAERDRIARIIFVKVDNTLPSPEHPSIHAAVAKILEAPG